MPQEGSGARVVRNSLVYGLGQFLAVAVSIVLTPFLIRGLGTAAYGVFVLALTFTFFGGWAALADLGVEAATVRYVAEARSADDLPGVNATVSTAMLFFGALALVIAPILVGGAEALVGAFSIEPALQDEARLTFALVACQLVFELPARALFAVLQGSQRFGTFQAVEVSRALIQAALFVAVLSTGPDIVLLAGAMLATSVLVFVLAWIYSHRAIPELRLSPRSASRAELRRLATFGGGILATRVIGTLYRQMDKLIIGTVLGTRLVTPYEVANKVQSGPSMVRSIAASSLLPATAYIRGQREVLRDMYLRGTNYTVAVTLPVVAGTFIFTGPLIAGWVGDALRDDADGTTRLFLAYLAVGLPQAVGQSMLVALGRIRPVLVIATSALAINVVVSLALVSSLGIEGVVIGTLISGVVTWPSLLRLCLREFGVSVREWLWGVALPNLPGLAAQAVTGLPMLRLAEAADSLPVTGALLLLSVLLSLAAYLGVGLRGPQRHILLTTLREALGIRIGADAAPQPESSTP